MILKGFKFGMLLQFAIGPVCIFIFQMASLKGFFSAETGVFGAALIDGLYIIAAILGIGPIINRTNIKFLLKIISVTVVLIFGFSTIIGQFDVSIFPRFRIYNSISSYDNVFIRAVILTISSPLTIIFWASIFSTKILEESLKRKSLYQFGFGAILATIFFLTLVVFIGSIAKVFFQDYIIKILNIMVGFVLIFFSIRISLKK